MLPGIGGLGGFISGQVFLPHRYWRVMNYINSGSGSHTGVTQIEMAESLGGSDVTNSSFAISGSAPNDGSAAQAFSNNTSTNLCQWFQTPGNALWIGQDFGAGNEKSILEIRIWPNKDGADRTFGYFSVDYSDNGTTWTTLWYAINTSWSVGTGVTFSYAAFSLGAERFTDPSFDNAGSWTASGGWSISGGNAVGSSAADRLVQTGVFVNTKRYIVEIPSYTKTAGSRLRIRTDAGTNMFLSPVLDASGSLKAFFTANGTEFRLEADTAAFSGTIASISAKEITF